MEDLVGSSDIIVLENSPAELELVTLVTFRPTMGAAISAFYMKLCHLVSHFRENNNISCVKYFQCRDLLMKM